MNPLGRAVTFELCPNEKTGVAFSPNKIHGHLDCSVSLRGGEIWGGCPGLVTMLGGGRGSRISHIVRNGTAFGVKVGNRAQKVG